MGLRIEAVAAIVPCIGQICNKEGSVEGMMKLIKCKISGDFSLYHLHKVLRTIHTMYTSSGQGCVCVWWPITLTKVFPVA